MKNLPYNREAVLRYAEKWAMKRNPAYLDFENLGGDCTNFASQCVYAGSNVMNPKKTFGWYYYNSYDRTPSWTGVQYIYDFLTGNKGVGPYAKEIDASKAEPGDLVQLGYRNGSFFHTPVLIAKNLGEFYVAAHSFDAYMRPLSSYSYEQIRFLHIEGVRDW